MKKKMKLSDFKVKSFITSYDDAKRSQLKGGTDLPGATVNCISMLHICTDASLCDTTNSRVTRYETCTY